MTEVLKVLTDYFDKRMALRRRMMEHMGITRRPELAEDLRPFLRQTRTACNRCNDPDECQTWLDSGAYGPPKFCRGRLSFE